MCGSFTPSSGVCSAQGTRVERGREESRGRVGDVVSTREWEAVPWVEREEGSVLVEKVLRPRGIKRGI